MAKRTPKGKCPTCGEPMYASAKKCEACGMRRPRTPRGVIRERLRKYLWLMSNERAYAVKRDHNTCQRCGAKGSVARGREVKIEVHHKSGKAGLDAAVTAIMDTLLPDPAELECVCYDCHKKEHEVKQ
jgi:sarcosine oxidase delta subunit